jgi:hypothetical protein
MYAWRTSNLEMTYVTLHSLPYVNQLCDIRHLPS